MGNFDYDKFIANAAADQSSALASEELELLRKVMAHPAVVKLLAYTLTLLMKSERSFTSMDLGSGSGVAAAIRLQGNLEGYARFVEVLGQVVAGNNLEEEFENV